MLTCRELTELITDYIEGRLSFREQLRVQMHLGMCRHCRRYLRQMKSTVRLLGSLPGGALPPDLESELMRRFANWKEKPGRG
jgi:predicted anti-sigma-YlaC factor YlaD